MAVAGGPTGGRKKALPINECSTPECPLSDWPLPARVVATIIGLVIIVALIVAGIASSVAQSPPSVARYCSYGAVSYEQYDACQTHVTDDEVEAADGNAGRYGRYEIDSCRWDSGPLCGVTDRPQPDDGWDRAGP